MVRCGVQSVSARGAAAQSSTGFTFGIFLTSHTCWTGGRVRASRFESSSPRIMPKPATVGSECLNYKDRYVGLHRPSPLRQLRGCVSDGVCLHSFLNDFCECLSHLDCDFCYGFVSSGKPSRPLSCLPTIGCCWMLREPLPFVQSSICVFSLVMLITLQNLCALVGGDRPDPYRIGCSLKHLD